jgi:hypothetical protein
LVTAARQRGRHVVCGPEEHSSLVAGSSKAGFFLWDPDESVVRVERMLKGALTLRKLFAAFAGQPIDFWQYACEFK